MMSTNRLACFSIVAVLAMAAASGFAWTAAPEIERIAVHWNFAGEPVAFRSKEAVLALPPILAALFGLLMLSISRRSNEVRDRRHNAIWLAGMMSLVIVHMLFALAVAGIISKFGNFTVLGPAVFMGVVGNYLAKGNANRWPGRLLVLASITTFAVWFLVPGAWAELVFVVGILIGALTAAFARRVPDTGVTDTHV